MSLSMKNRMLSYSTIFLVFLTRTAGAGAGTGAPAPCTTEEFLSKVCVSSQAFNLNGAELAELICEDRPVHAKTYAHFKDAFELAPPFFQKYLCGLDRVVSYYVAQGTALSWAYPKLNTIGVSKSRMDEGYDLAEHAETMMAQVRRKKAVPEDAVFPKHFGYHAPSPTAGAGLLYLLAHEMGHLIYNNPKDNAFRNENFHTCIHFGGLLNCNDFRKPQYGLIDWITGKGPSDQIVRGEVKAEWASLRSYITAQETENYTPEKAKWAFEFLQASSFVSAFALFSPEEDFCETFAHKVLSQTKSILLFTDFQGTRTIDVWDRVRRPPHPRLKEKLEFVERILKTYEPPQAPRCDSLMK